MKRFQECNKLIQMWRYRWYLLIPFESMYYFLKGNGNLRLHWGLAVGMAQIRMKWYYTSEEMDELLKPLFDKINNSIKINDRRK